MTLNISNIQHFSVGDGAGIRTTVFFKGCDLVCPWCHNPENLSSTPTTLQYRGGKCEVRGRQVTPDDILPELLEDKDFFDASGGGITLSGGEVMLQADGAAALAALLKAHGVSVLIDTAGCVPYTAFERLNPVIDGYLFDLKTADAAKYRAIGGDLDLVVSNLTALQRDGVPFTVRIPLIPDFNTDKDSVAALGELLRSLDIRYAELLPFHRLGSAKYEAMGLEYPYKDYAPPTADESAATAALFEPYVNVKLER
ncbi:MAG: radical SAM protein [Ruminococcaceae bacterium]|nr:radical SAM protein [Oscillospiraceae bacterium]